MAVPSGKVYFAAGGAVLAVDGNKAVPFATGLDEPAAIAAFGDALFVADKNGVRRIDRTGQARVLAAAGAFPRCRAR